MVVPSKTYHHTFQDSQLATWAYDNNSVNQLYATLFVCYVGESCFTTSSLQACDSWSTAWIGYGNIGFPISIYKKDVEHSFLGCISAYLCCMIVCSHESIGTGCYLCQIKIQKSWICRCKINSPPFNEYVSHFAVIPEWQKMNRKSLFWSRTYISMHFKNWVTFFATSIGN